jgi:hypothetical protein
MLANGGKFMDENGRALWVPLQRLAAGDTD